MDAFEFSHCKKTPPFSLWNFSPVAVNSGQKRPQGKPGTPVSLVTLLAGLGAALPLPDTEWPPLLGFPIALPPLPLQTGHPAGSWGLLTQAWVTVAVCSSMAYLR